MKSSLYTASMLIGFGFASSAYSADMSAEDFVKKASVSNLFEIQSSELALERAKDPEVKQFAQQMIDDHTKASNNLKTSLQNTKIEKDAVATNLDAEHQTKLSDLRDEEGDAFDQKYLDLQVKAHDEAVTLFRNFAENGDDKTLKQFATATLPTLEMHQEHVNKLD